MYGQPAISVAVIALVAMSLAVGPAFAQDAVVPEASADCASLQSQFDQAAATASSEQLSAAKSVREGEKLCSEGKTEEGAAKLQEAISALSQPSQQPMEQPPTEQPPMGTEQPPTDTQQPPR